MTKSSEKEFPEEGIKGNQISMSTIKNCIELDCGDEDKQSKLSCKSECPSASWLEHLSSELTSRCHTRQGINKHFQKRVSKQQVRGKKKEIASAKKWGSQFHSRKTTQFITQLQFKSIRDISGCNWVVFTYNSCGFILKVWLHKVTQKYICW